jgi:hypothetical protein
MESFKLNLEDRDKLFFNKYKYRATCQLLGVRFTYYCTTVKDFQKKIEKRRQDPWHYGKQYSNDDLDLNAIEFFIKWRNTYKKDSIIRIEYDTFAVFSNDLELLKTLEEIGSDIQYTEANVIAPGVKFFKNKPKHDYRIYLKGIRLDSDKVDHICSFVENYKTRDSVKISSALVHAVSNGRINSSRWMHNSYYIDYNEESMLTLLRLVFPGILSSKIYKLESEQNKHKYSEKMEYLDGENS